MCLNSTVLISHILFWTFEYVFLLFLFSVILWQFRVGPEGRILGLYSQSGPVWVCLCLEEVSWAQPFYLLICVLLFTHAFGSLKAHLCYFSSFPALFQDPNSPQHRHICLHPSRINSALSEKIFTCKIQDNFTHTQYWVVSLLQRIIQHCLSPGLVPWCGSQGKYR